MATREEMLDAALRYMLRTFGPANKAHDRDSWMAKYGMLVDFVTDEYPPAQAKED
jgi:hypothetical protein